MSVQKYANYKRYTGTDTSITLDIVTDLGRVPANFAVENSGASDFTFTAQTFINGTFGDSITVKAGKTVDISGLNVRQITITNGSSSTYQVIAF